MSYCTLYAAVKKNSCNQGVLLGIIVKYICYNTVVRAHRARLLRSLLVMKKKLLTILSVLVLAAVMIVATACGNGTLFQKNNERDMTQLTASVTYAGRSSQVTKTELNSAMYNSLQLVSQHLVWRAQWLHWHRLFTKLHLYLWCAES